MRRSGDSVRHDQLKDFADGLTNIKRWIRNTTINKTQYNLHVQFAFFIFHYTYVSTYMWLTTHLIRNRGYNYASVRVFWWLATLEVSWSSHMGSISIWYHNGHAWISETLFLLVYERVSLFLSGRKLVYSARRMCWTTSTTTKSKSL